MRSYKKYLLLLPVVMASLFSVGQGVDIGLKDLNIPNAPAFTILDYAPATIDRPGTAKAFATNIVQLVQESSGLPKNFAFEVSPYWLFPNKLNAYKYHGIDPVTKRQNNIFANARNASVSIGSVFRDSTKEHKFDGNYFAVGARVNLIKIIRKPVVSGIVASASTLASRIVAVGGPVVAACLAAGHAPNSPEYNQCIEKGLTTGFAADAATQLHQKRLTQLLAVKPIFQLDIAGAGSWIYKDNTLSESHSYRMGVWTTMEFSLPLSSTTDVEEMIANQNYLNLYASFRYIQEDSTTDFKTFSRQDLLDIGGRLEVEFNKFNLSFEAIRRFNQRDKDLNTSRNVGILQYKINDQLFLTGTFGKNFGTVKNLIALFGINWGFGKQSLVQN